MRGKRATRRAVLADPRYQSVVVARFVNKVMERGKKSVARTIVYRAFDVIAQKTKRDPRDVFEQALKNVGPSVEVRSRRVGGANYQIPVEVRPERRLALTFRWILEAARAKRGRPMYQKLADELIAAAENQGDAIKKREDVLRMAEANRAFAHFA